ncbi:hypothetical protein N658DRAFT_434380 [Parathielavia hyrcaniae]|uniref:Zn(2)-C6 fungal-type domain-containing protein n=1 Tax=Parathielavia hyrcaniae TaxID=113614 RepID=A0AAN6PSQ5_9PEZI|nr:hypothetical protein N658DRAFT_434380 [Parathielavia hyrcaniae]
MPTPSTPADPGSGASDPSIQQPQGYSSVGRRTHKKSRTGCSKCKARKIKCDERHPACLNCISHGVECPFLKGDTAVKPPTRASKTKPQSAASPATTAPSTARPSPAATLPESEALPLLELELLHNYTTKTYSTLTADPSLWDFWRDDVVQQGLACDYVMRAVLAVSALHLAYHRPDRRDFYIEEGILLHQKASRSAMRVMAVAAGDGDKMDKHQAAELFLFSVLTFFFALAAPRRSHPDGTFFIGDSGVPDWAFLLSGGKSVLAVLGERGLETFARPFLRYGRGRWDAQRAIIEARSGEPPLLDPLRARIAAAVSDPGLLRTYAYAVDELELALVVRQDPGATRDVLDAMVWLWMVSDSFVPLLKVSAQEAVAIFAHYCVLLKHHESHWWLQGWGDHVMARAHEILDEEHRAWIEWPIREMGGMVAGNVER